VNWERGFASSSMTKKDLTLAPQYTPPQENNTLIPVSDGGSCEGIDAAAFSPRTKFIYYGARYEPSAFQTSPTNTSFWGATVAEVIPGVTASGIFGATDSTTGKAMWKINVGQPPNSGMLVARDLAFFGGSNGKFHGVDAATGKMLFTVDGTTVPKWWRRASCTRGLRH